MPAVQRLDPEDRRRLIKKQTRSIIRRWEFWVIHGTQMGAILTIAAMSLPSLPFMSFAFLIGAFGVPIVLITLICQHFTLRLVNRVILESNPHLCRACGYDLRTTPDRCPECGTIPAVPE